MTGDTMKVWDASGRLVGHVTETSRGWKAVGLDGRRVCRRPTRRQASFALIAATTGDTGGIGRNWEKNPGAFRARNEPRRKTGRW